MKLAANRPAPGDHNSFVNKYVEIAVKPLKLDRKTMHAIQYISILSVNYQQIIFLKIEFRSTD